jgi:hypothetical protein
MPVTRAFPDAVTTVDTAAQYELGTEWPMDAGEAEALDSTVQGPQCWVYVKATVALAEGEIAAIADGTANYEVKLAAVAASSKSLIGVAQHAIGINAFGWILRKGFGEVMGDSGGYTVNTALIVGDAAGAAADLGGATAGQAFAHATEGVGAAALGTCFINI